MPNRPKGQPPKQYEPRVIGPAAPRGTKGYAYGEKPPKEYPLKEVHPGQRQRTIGPMAPRRPRKSEQKILEEKHTLRQEAEEKFPEDSERQDAYVYGTMRKQGWKPDHHSPWDGKTWKHWYFGKTRV